MLDLFKSKIKSFENEIKEQQRKLDELNLIYNNYMEIIKENNNEEIKKFIDEYPLLLSVIDLLYLDDKINDKSQYLYETSRGRTITCFLFYKCSLDERYFINKLIEFISYKENGKLLNFLENINSNNYWDYECEIDKEIELFNESTLTNNIFIRLKQEIKKYNNVDENITYNSIDDIYYIIDIKESIFYELVKIINECNNLKEYLEQQKNILLMEIKLSRL